MGFFDPILLSPPSATEGDVSAVVRAIESGWLAPVGPDLSSFELDMAAYLGVGHAVGLSSGTAALHLALKYVGVREGDVVLVPTVTFAATAFAVSYLGATPVFVDIEPEGWGMDPGATVTALQDIGRLSRRVAAAVPVDLYGAPADYGSLLPVLAANGIPVVEDAAEGLGARFEEHPLGTLGSAGVLSFNGNKLITTSGGGMLVTDDGEMAERVRKWATQSREDAPWYEHTEIGYNYRLSNLLAALGRSQLARVDAEVMKRRQIREWYRDRLKDLAGVEVQSDPPWGRSNAWLTVVRFDSALYPDGARRVREALETHRIESRPIWKPMHQQPVFKGNPAFLTGVADELFRDGLCLPSGTSLEVDDIDRIGSVIEESLRA